MKTGAYRIVFLLVSAATFGWGQPAQQFAELGRCALDSGAVIEDCRVGYRTAGRLNAGKSNAILWPTWFTGKTADLTGFAGPGKLLDTDRFFVVFVDAFSNGVSSSPSNSELQRGMNFPPITIRDMVRAQYRLVTEVLGIERLHAVMGISMGGMQTYEWAVSYPGAMRKLVPIVGSPWMSASDVMLWTAQRESIVNHKDWNGGEYGDAPVMMAANAMHGFALTSAPHHARTKKAGETAGNLVTGTRALMEKMNACDYVRQLEAMLSQDIARGGDLGSVRIAAEMLTVLADQDMMVNPRPGEELARKAGSKVVWLDGDCGHLATSCREEVMRVAIQEFLGGPQ
jgi:homoserine O-acetyltransferase